MSEPVLTLLEAARACGAAGDLRGRDTQVARALDRAARESPPFRADPRHAAALIAAGHGDKIGQLARTDPIRHDSDADAARVLLDALPTDLVTWCLETCPEEFLRHAAALNWAASLHLRALHHALARRAPRAPADAVALHRLLADALDALLVPREAFTFHLDHALRSPAPPRDLAAALAAALHARASAAVLDSVLECEVDPTEAMTGRPSPWAETRLCKRAAILLLLGAGPATARTRGSRAMRRLFARAGSGHTRLHVHATAGSLADLIARPPDDPHIAALFPPEAENPA